MREINFSISHDGSVTPALPQYGGVKGEHRAAVVRFTMPEPSFYTEGDTARINFYAGDGTVLSSDIIEDIITEDGGASLSYELPKTLTIPGGQLCMRIVLSQFDEDGNEVLTFQSGEAVVWFEDAAVENGTPFWTGVSEMLKRTAWASVSAVDAQVQAIDAAQAAAKSGNAAAMAAADAQRARDEAEAASQTAVTAAQETAAAKDMAQAAAQSAEEYAVASKIQSAVINDSGEIVLTYSDGKSVNLGKVTGRDGKSAFAYAQDGGFDATEEEFASVLASLPKEAIMRWKGQITGPTMMGLTDMQAGDLYYIVSGSYGSVFVWTGMEWKRIASNINVLSAIDESAASTAGAAVNSAAVIAYVTGQLNTLKQTAETWTFELEDGTTVEKTVILA